MWIFFLNEAGLLGKPLQWFDIEAMQSKVDAAYKRLQPRFEQEREHRIKALAEERGSQVGYVGASVLKNARSQLEDEQAKKINRILSSEMQRAVDKALEKKQLWINPIITLFVDVLGSLIKGWILPFFHWR